MNTYARAARRFAPAGKLAAKFRRREISVRIKGFTQ